MFMKGNSDMHPFIVESSTQGIVLQECLKAYFVDGQKGLEEFVKLYRHGGYKRIVFSGMGSSYYAPFSVVGKLTENGIPAFVINAAELSGPQLGLIEKDTLLVAVSQSGNSLETVNLVNRLDRDDIVGVCNVMDSPMAQKCRIILPILSGTEKFISSKSYLNTVAVLMMMTAALINEFNDSFKNQMQSLAEWATEYLKNVQAKRNEVMSFVEGTDIFDFIADHGSVATAYQACLIFREGPQFATYSNITAEYSHGGYLLAKPGVTGFQFDPKAPKNTIEENMRNYVLDKGGKVILITSAKDVESTDMLRVVRYPEVDAWLAPIAEALPVTTLMGWLLEVSNNAG